MVRLQHIRGCSKDLLTSWNNGDLGFASFPVVAGHFINDGILNAERAIDYYLKWALTERHQLGLYPGEIGTSEILLTKGSTFKGGIIIGLGQLGSLTAFQLSRSVESATLKYLLGLRNNDNVVASRTGIGLSTLAIGCGYGGLTIESSLRAVLQGIQNANSKMKQLHADNALAVDTVEVVEQYEDKALDCFYALNTIEKEEDQTLNIITTKKKYKTIFGSRRRLPTDNNEEWWTRIHVQPREQGLRFNISTGGAREEQRDLLTSREIIQELVEEFSINNRWTVKLAKTIFELLVPNDFKEQLKKKSNIAWIVDKDTASYPWELLQDSLNNAKPLSINAGMVRQLATQDYRINNTIVPKNNALVIADPELRGFVGQLPGALKEGEKVSQILKENGFETTSILRGHHSEIIQGLFSNEYKIIHLAGHGVFNEKDPDKSGMVIGKNVFLKTRDVAQMSALPELVVVNCCYLGQMNSVAEEYYQKRYRLAANIGTQLIENGVKAVIVAGWAVDDQAALEFTEVFYECMFDGFTFGKAVQKAREVIYNKYPRTNTWGAYQCYGDQYYQLQRKVRKQKKKDYVIAIEAEIELNNLLNKTEIPGYSPEELEKELEIIIEAVDRSGIRNGVITEREALIYYSLGDYENAISKYESLLPMENASFSFSAMEKYCNMRARQVIAKFRKGGEPIDALRDQINKVIRDLENLLSYGETSERLSVLASAYKRKAILCNTDERMEAWSKAAYYYYTASNGKRQSLYALSNWLQMESLLILNDKRKWGEEIISSNGSYRLPVLSDAITGIEKKLELLATGFAGDMNYWDLSNEANLLLSLLLMNPGQSFEDVMKAYLKVWQNAGSRGQKTSELEHFEFLSDSLADSLSEQSMQLSARLESLKHACVSMQ